MAVPHPVLSKARSNAPATPFTAARCPGARLRLPSWQISAGQRGEPFASARLPLARFTSDLCQETVVITLCYLRCCASPEYAGTVGLLQNGRAMIQAPFSEKKEPKWLRK